MPTAPCAHCGQHFPTSSQRTRFCKRTCYRAWQRETGASSLVARFWAKVNKTNGCWLWTAGQIRGYGQFHVGRDERGQNTTVYAHRFSWEQTNGQITDNLSVLHRCDTPLCVNPNHLFLGSQADNLNDARAKGRLVDGRHLIKVPDAGVRDIREHYVSHRNGRQLAAKYGISLTHLLLIVAGKTRKSVRPSLERVPHVSLAVRGEAW